MSDQGHNESLIVSIESKDDERDNALDQTPEVLNNYSHLNHKTKVLDDYEIKIA